MTIAFTFKELIEQKLKTTIKRGMNKEEPFHLHYPCEDERSAQSIGSIPFFIR
jgi:hypothetical protein